MLYEVPRTCVMLHAMKLLAPTLCADQPKYTGFAPEGGLALEGAVTTVLGNPLVGCASHLFDLQSPGKRFRYKGIVGIDSDLDL
jgi:hypothetical protein